jgi:hypothetical protein
VWASHEKKKLFEKHPISDEVEFLIYLPIANAMMDYFDYESNPPKCFQASDPHHTWNEFNIVIKDTRPPKKCKSNRQASIRYVFERSTTAACNEELCLIIAGLPSLFDL